MTDLRIPDRKARLALPVGLCACGRSFVQLNTMQRICVPCAIKAPKLKRKAEREDIKRRKDAIKTRKELTAEAQAEVNKYVRLRDLAAGHGCIDCGKPFEPQKIGGSVDAGHFRSVGSAPHLRFDLRNIHAQRKNCNMPGGATPAAYEAGLRLRIGDEAVDALKSDQAPRHYTVDDLREMRDRYRKMARDLTKQQENP